MGKVNFTPAQQAAIENHGGALLVAASAGSGKTRVLVERLISMISGDKAEHSIKEFLVITYTKAAAAELKGKIMDELASRLSEDPRNRQLRRQYNMCCNADISTIHSFCGNIIRENAHLLGISSDFRVAEESESDIIRHTVLDKVLDERYEHIGEYTEFRKLADMMSAGKDDKQLAEIVLETYNKLQSHPDPEKWAEEQLKMYNTDGINDISETKWGNFVLNKHKITVKWWKDKIFELTEKMADCTNFVKAYGASITATYDGITKLCNAMDIGWDAAVLCENVPFPKPKPISGYDDFKETRTRCKAAIQKIEEQLVNTSNDLLEDIKTMEPVIRELVSLVLDFGNAYSKEKIRRGLVDYSDLEHFAVKLLIDEETGEQTAIAKSIAKKYTEVMVDEYQDVNAVQELIFNAVSSDGKNIFMVGDVKQSIYRFRLADPTIFLQKYNTFSEYENALEGEGRKIILANNFRSRAGILAGVNYVFSNIMSTEFGEMEYTPKEYLYPGREFEDNGEKEIELDILDMASSAADDEERPEKIDIEANFIASRIKELVENKMLVTGDDDRLRPVEYGDIAILLRSSKSKAARYANAMEKLNIPVAINRGESFFETIEINIMMSLLSIIDNPLQDVQLISVLRSVVYGFTADDLVMIRTKQRDGYFYDALVLAAKDDEKCRKFIEELNYYRQMAPDMSANELIWHIYHTTGMLGIIGAMDSGAARVENLRQFVAYAYKFESAGYKGIFAFVLYMHQLMEKGENPGAETEEQAENAVRIMSMHKSKGLEFPVVFLVDLSKRFNMDDTRKQILIHHELGIGAKMRDVNRKIEYSTIARQAIAEKITLETMSEELRVLYVAMTRAREKLIMVCSYADWERERKRIISDMALPVAPQLLMNSRSSSEWIIRTAIARKEATSLRDYGVKTEGEWNINLINASDYVSLTADTKAESKAYTTEADELMVQKVKNNLEFVYPYENAINIPSKLTATELKGQKTDAELAEEAEYITQSVREIKLRRPSFENTEKELTATEKGTLMHLVMQHIEPMCCEDKRGIKSEIDRLVKGGIIPKAYIDSVDADMIERFFTSDIGKRMVASKKCEREFKFSVLIPACEFYDCNSDDKILLQGVIDCFFEENDEFVLVDFKTDNVDRAGVYDRACTYTGQMRAYRKALEQIAGKKVKETVLFFLRAGEIINIE